MHGHSPRGIGLCRNVGRSPVRSGGYRTGICRNTVNRRNAVVGQNTGNTRRSREVEAVRYAF